MKLTGTFNQPIIAHRRTWMIDTTFFLIVTRQIPMLKNIERFSWSFHASRDEGDSFELIDFWFFVEEGRFITQDNLS